MWGVIDKHIDSFLVVAQNTIVIALIAAIIAFTISAFDGLITAYRKAKANGRKVTFRVWAREFFVSVLFTFFIGLIGGLTGQLGGGSRQAVVGAMVPATFTLFGGYLAYYLGVKKDRSGNIAVNTLAFLLTFFIVYNLAAVWRQSNENWDFCRELYSNPDFETKDQMTYRQEAWGTYCGAVFARWTSE